MDLTKMSKAELGGLKAELEKQVQDFKAAGLKLDMSRGKPGPEQLDLSEGILSVVTSNSQVKSDGVDVRNYGGLEGLLACRKLFAEMLDVPVENVIAGGNSSLTMMYDTMMRLWVFGAAGVKKPWAQEEMVRFLCPSPGYDRHFAICQQLGIEMIPVPMLEDGPDMDRVETLAGGDPLIKGMWCVPMYSNPEGKTYSDEVVRRLANMKTAADDFRIFWDNAYCVHHLFDEHDHVLNLLDECKKAGTEDRVLMFASTSKVTYPGAGVAVLVCSDNNIAWTKDIMKVQAIGPDKVNQLRHALYFGDAEGVRRHMKKQADILRPKFQVVLDALEGRLAGTGAGTWHTPRGGYFVSFNAMPGCAKRIHQLCKDAGLNMTGAGATYPYGRDPEDSNLRIAPSYPSVDELKKAMDLFCTCALLASCEKLLEA